MKRQNLQKKYILILQGLEIGQSYIEKGQTRQILNSTRQIVSRISLALKIGVTTEWNESEQIFKITRTEWVELEDRKLYSLPRKIPKTHRVIDPRIESLSKGKTGDYFIVVNTHTNSAELHKLRRHAKSLKLEIVCKQDVDNVQIKKA